MIVYFDKILSLNKTLKVKNITDSQSMLINFSVVTRATTLVFINYHVKH